MRRGDIYLFDYEPVKGSEANKHKRPSVIVSPDELNFMVEKKGTGVVTVVPLSSSIDFLHDYHTLLPAEITQLDKDSKAQIEQVRSLSAGRIRSELISSIPSSYLEQVLQALRLYFS